MKRKILAASSIIGISAGLLFGGQATAIAATDDGGRAAVYACRQYLLTVNNAPFVYVCAEKEPSKKRYTATWRDFSTKANGIVQGDFDGDIKNLYMNGGSREDVSEFKLRACHNGTCGDWQEVK